MINANFPCRQELHSMFLRRFHSIMAQMINRSLRQLIRKFLYHHGAEFEQNFYTCIFRQISVGILPMADTGVRT